MKNRDLGVVGLLLAAVVLCWPSSVMARCNVDDMVSTYDMSECASKNVKESDAQHKKLYQQLLNKSDAFHKKLVMASEKSWVLYKNTTCAAEADIYRGGTFLPVGHALCVDKMNLERNEWLEQMITPGESDTP